MRQAEGSHPIRQATLLGRDHTGIGELAAVAEGPAAITICRGGAPKTYSYVDPNEDAVAFVMGERGVLLAVADGHDGHQGAAAAVGVLRDAFGPAWCTGVEHLDAGDWGVAACAAVAQANHAVLSEAGARGAPTAPTTLAFALWRREEALVHGASVGDSHVFFSGIEETVDLARSLTRDQKRADFLGRGVVTEGEAAEITALETQRAGALRALVLATDGLSERGIGVSDPEAEVHRAREHAWGADDEIRPLAVAKAVTAVAMRAQREQRAGDNIACAVALLD